MKTRYLLSASLLTLPAFTLFAQEKPFQENHTLTICESELSGQEQAADFRELFPELFAAVERHREEGLLADVYLMTALGEGVVFFATNKGGDSQANADNVIKEMKDLLAESDTEITLQCETITVGPKLGE